MAIGTFTVSQALGFLEGDEGQKNIAGQRQIERIVGFYGGGGRAC